MGCSGDWNWRYAHLSSRNATSRRARHGCFSRWCAATCRWKARRPSGSGRATRLMTQGLVLKLVRNRLLRAHSGTSVSGSYILRTRSGAKTCSWRPWRASDTVCSLVAARRWCADTPSSVSRPTIACCRSRMPAMEATCLATRRLAFSRVFSSMPRSFFSSSSAFILISSSRASRSASERARSSSRIVSRSFAADVAESISASSWRPSAQSVEVCSCVRAWCSSQRRRHSTSERPSSSLAICTPVRTFSSFALSASFSAPMDLYSCTSRESVTSITGLNVFR
mmetsp:Transcript_146/g.365  ORF Transcript_146/g.365 Transcript_146/m.365 type:complete len:282 (-) Transcript_146:265-1110(-)